MEAPAGVSSPEPDPAAAPFARVAGVFGFPTATFQSIARRPGWVVPLILLTVLSVVATVALLPRLDVETAIREKIAEGDRQIPEDRIDDIVATQKRIGVAFAYFWALLGPTLVTLLLSAIFLGAFKAFGWNVTFRQSLGITAHALLPTIFASMLLIFFASGRDLIHPADVGTLSYSNPGVLVDRQNPALRSIASSIDVFSLWSLALLALGFSLAARIPWKRAAILLGVLWACYVLGKAGLSALFA